ncbi:RhoGAP-domain-containing protein, partial [Microstroma glucosiphilum]
MHSRKGSVASIQSGGQTAPEEDKVAKSPTTRRAAMDRIKSRAVDSGWNWEAERERGEDGTQQRSDRGQLSDGQGQQQGASSFAVPPRYSSRPSAGPSRSRNDSFQGPQLPNTPSSSSPRNSLTQNRAGEGGNIPPSHSHPTQRDRHMTPSGSSSGKREQLCDACGKPMTGQFVRALGVVFHLDCFRCRDCNKVVASKFFPATEDMKDATSPTTAGDEDQRSRPSDGKGVPQKLFPLCETDYFRRLDLLCATCGGALRGSYITALGKKFHVEHFTCSVCTTVFGPQDSYYEHDGRVFCHFHYSTRFAIQCSGCRTAILKQFVEINRNNQDEHWHPECYMIHKFWNIKLCPTGATPKGSVAAEPTVSDAPAPSNSGVAPTTGASASDLPGPEALEIEASETPSSLKKKQKTMEEQVFRIWTVLSAFEESSAACISEMLRHVSSGRYLGGVRMAERFILHVEILFSAIDDIERAFRRERTKGLSHIREARMLCKKIVNFFSLLSHTQETGAQRMGITQELLSLVTGLAHYLKILIRIALTGALKLDRDHDNRSALVRFLDQLAYLAERAALSAEEKGNDNERGDFPSNELSMQGPDGKWYGYRSLPRSTSIASTDGNEGATDLCVSCGQTVEEECVRMGINMRWHTSCLRCCHCKRRAHKESSGQGTQSASRKTESDSASEDLPSLPPSAFALEVTARPPPAEGSQRNGGSSSRKLFLTYCSEHSPANARRGFETGTRLEQYAFLLRVALNRLYALLKKRGVVPASPPAIAPTEISNSDSTATIKGADRDSTYGDSTEVRRMKSVNLDRKLSTKAKVPRISTVIGSPSGRQPTASSMQRISPSTDGGSTDSRLPSPRDGSQQNILEATRSRSPSKKPFRRSPSPVRGSTAGSSPVPEPGSVIPIRPAFARHNTDVRIREDGPMRQPSGDDGKDPLGAHDEGLTLADIPQLLEAEQAREQRRSLQHDGRSLGELSALELFIVKHMAVMMLQQSPLKDMVPMDDLIEFIETRKNTFWGKLFKGGKDKKKVEKKGTFGIALDILVERSGADSTLGASGAQLRIPCFVDDIISAMKQMDVSVEGIFRKNGNIRRLKELSEALDRDSSSVNLADDNPVQLAALLKKFLRELPDPLLTFKLHRLFVMSQKIEPESERLRVLQLVTILLPKAHRDTLEVLFVFLRWVASFSHVDEETGSKMDLQNLAMVLGPNILYAKSGDPAKDELFLANRAILCLLEHLDDFWQIPPELDVVLQDRDLLNASADLTSRDILKKCEKYARRAGPNRGGGIGGNGSGDSG